nr:reverse transcriptase domain-containing protein [Tanacetum cinerariifolium]
MKLNPKKCAFGMRKGTFLGYKVDADELRVYPNKVEAVLNLPSPKCLQDVQKLNGKLASLNRFLSKSAEKSLPFFKTLKKCTKKSDFQWTVEAEVAFKEMKQLIAELPMRARHLVQTKDVSKRTNSGELHRVASGGRHTRYINGGQGKTPKPMDIIHGRIIMHRRFQSRLNNHESESMEFTYALRFRFNATNNEAEYEALIAGLRIAGKIGVQNLQANVDSKLVANQGKRNRRKRDTSGSRKRRTHLDDSVYEYLTEGILPKEKKKAMVVRCKAGRYAVINEVLYKKSFLGPWLRCVGPLQANYVLREIHEGSCSMHAGPRSVVAKALRLGYYWPTMHMDARNLIRECNDCQGIDIAGPFPEGPGKVKFLIVAIDYFTEWIEARPVV